MENEILRNETPSFQLNEAKVLVLSSMPLVLCASLSKLVEHYNKQSYMDDTEALRSFVVFLTCDLLYPVQVCPTNSSSNGK